MTPSGKARRPPPQVEQNPASLFPPELIWTTLCTGTLGCGDSITLAEQADQRPPTSHLVLIYRYSMRKLDHFSIHDFKPEKASSSCIYPYPTFILVTS